MKFKPIRPIRPIKSVEKVENQRFGEERALYGARGLQVENCRFEGEEDGESALKEGRQITVLDSYFALRYPFWHDVALTVRNCEMTETCRAPFWYDKDVTMDGCKMHGVKAFRECRGVTVKNSDVVSPEFGWRTRKINLFDTSLSGEYAFLGSSRIVARGLRFSGKYAFQYVKDAEIAESTLDTKDAFWHTKNVTVRDSVIRGEYLGWYSENLTLIRCKIIGTQPLCYCRDLTLIDCETEGCDLSFEYSSVTANIRGNVLSIKNPLSGKIVCDSVGEVILKDSVYPADCEIVVGGQRMNHL
ncbi:MAG: DUF3737 family protein [Clostridia bacterium]|nr:DUF3737 family protein [Clostridia bacterium]